MRKKIPAKVHRSITVFNVNNKLIAKYRFKTVYVLIKTKQ